MFAAFASVGVLSRGLRRILAAAGVVNGRGSAVTRPFGNLPRHRDPRPLVRVRRMSACGIPWPVCPRCLGEGLWGSAGRWRCPCCGGEWTEDERIPCPDPGTVALADEGGGGMVRLVCASHAVHPSAAKLRKALRLAPANGLDGKP